MCPPCEGRARVVFEIGSPRFHEALCAHAQGRIRGGPACSPERVVATLSGQRGCGSMAERELPKLETGVRFPSSARGCSGPSPLSSSSAQHRRRGRTQIHQRAVLAAGPPRLADGPAVTDEPDVHRHAQAGRDQLGQSSMGFRCRHPRGDQPQTRCHAMDVGIYRQRRPSEREGEDAGHGLRADAGQ
jgi:hypothetical protein